MKEISLPNWAKKPKHKKEVVATEKGWVIKETGEVLSSIRGLDTRLKSLHSVEQGKKEKPVEDIVDDSSVEAKQEEKIVEEKPVAKKSPKKTTKSEKQMKLLNLTHDNFRLFAMSHYDNPYCLNEAEFNKDLGIITRVKKILTRADNQGLELNPLAILNQIISFYNVFSLYGATKLLEFRIEEKHHETINSFLVFLSYPVIGEGVYNEDTLHQLKELTAR